jgi:hypothetical protein
LSEYTHSEGYSSTTNGFAVGAEGAEVPAISQTGTLYQNGSAIVGTAAELSRGRLKKVTGALAAVDTGGGIFSWQNPESGPILVQHVVLNVTTKTTGACSVDVGTTDTNATTSSDTLIDGKDINAATGIFTNDESAGTNGKPFKRLAAGKWVTASMVAGGATAGLVGTYEIYYTVL